jgi:ribonucleoside-diphosphate reductase alpha chain
MFIKMGIKYGEQKSIELCNTIGATMINIAIQTSTKLTQIYGVYPKYNEESILKSQFFIQNTTEETKELVKKYGLANSQFLTIAPTGTLSTMLGISGGIEPIYNISYKRKTESLHGKDVYYNVYTSIIEEYMKNNNIDDEKKLPDFINCAMNLNYNDRIKMQSTWQQYIDASISSTINLPENITIEDVENIYINAWKMGLKGVTIFRDNCERVGILTNEKEEVIDDIIEFDSLTPVSRTKFGTVLGTTAKYKSACGSLWVTINRDDEGNLIETFIHTSKGGICKSNVDAISRLVSACLRNGMKVEYVIKQLKGISCQACRASLAQGNKLDGISCPDVLSKVIQQEYDREELIVRKSKKRIKRKIEENKTFIKINNDNQCPECNATLNNQNGCKTCTECGYSRCD